ncbi:MAG: 30S ribosomal protein S12 methylthiotransferase RimO [Planctomycetes bacterium]|nr:30S ribosomal protein S12 methylthiotransferase RimO [Planctomycetota bacterium]
MSSPQSKIRNPIRLRRTKIPPRVSLISLGCPKNLVDSEKMLARIAERGAIICERAEDADTVLVNTCGFIKDAKQESVDVILEAGELKRQGRCRRIIVAGCLAQRYGDALKAEMPEIDAVIGVGRHEDVAALCCGSDNGGKRGRVHFAGTARRVLRTKCTRPLFPGECGPRLRLTPRHFAYLRVAEGCNNRCSYCIIPRIRGPFRSRPMGELLREAEELAADGVKELNVIAQDTTLYGADLYGQPRLHLLLRQISRLSFRWVRLLYTHPGHWYPELIDELATNEVLCRYVDLPVQHISDRILRRMGRRVTRKRVRDLIETLRNRIPGVALRTALIVGFPGETRQDFQVLLGFIERVRFERLGAFAYSREEDTRAARFVPQVAEKTKQRRLDAVMSLQQRIAFEQNAQWIGREVEVLIDSRADDGREWLGRTYADAPEVDGSVIVTGRGLSPGIFCRARITGTRGYDLVAEPVETGPR